MACEKLISTNNISAIICRRFDDGPIVVRLSLVQPIRWAVGTTHYPGDFRPFWSSGHSRPRTIQELRSYLDLDHNREPSDHIWASAILENFDHTWGNFIEVTSTKLAPLEHSLRESLGTDVVEGWWWRFDTLSPNASKGSCGEAKNMYKKYVFSDSFFVQAIGGRSNWSDGLSESNNMRLLSVGCRYS